MQCVLPSLSEEDSEAVETIPGMGEAGACEEALKTRMPAPLFFI